MLCELHIRNLALIREEEISFGRGLNILSGETGAGKSILLGALGLALGGRVPKDMLRSDADEGLAEAIFHVEDEALLDELCAMDLPLSEADPGEWILTRRIRDGRAVARINGETVPAGRLAEAGAKLLSVYGQNESQTLMHANSQRRMLDSYAGAPMEALLQELSKTWTAFREAEAALKEASADEASRLREVSFLEHEIAEIEGARLTEGEEEALDTRFRRMSHAQRLMEAAGEAQQSLEEAAASAVARAVRSLESVRAYDDEIASMADQLAEAESLFADLSRDLAGWLRDAEYDPQELDDIARRLDLIHGLEAKYGATIAQVQASLEEKKERMAQLADYDAWRSGLERECTRAREAYEDACARATALRTGAGERFAGELTQALLDLHFLDVRFSCRVEPVEEPGPAGADQVTFFISTNPGEPLRPLSAVASGGELSRIMLAVKTVQAKQGEIDTLIFDEIDAGISGATAQAVARRLHDAARHQQVICITHLPQIAAQADAHFLIAKSVRDGRTESSVRWLSEEESVWELARMLGGEEVTETALANARQLREAARA